MNFLKSKVVKTRKDHRCFGCSRNIPKGTKMEAITSVDGGDISTEYWCDTCRAYWGEFMRNDDYIGYGELRSEDEERWEEVRNKVEGGLTHERH